MQGIFQVSKTVIRTLEKELSISQLKKIVFFYVFISAHAQYWAINLSKRKILTFALFI